MEFLINATMSIGVQIEKGVWIIKGSHVLMDMHLFVPTGDSIVT